MVTSYSEFFTVPPVNCSVPFLRPAFLPAAPCTSHPPATTPATSACNSLRSPAILLAIIKSYTDRCIRRAQKGGGRPIEGVLSRWNIPIWICNILRAHTRTPSDRGWWCSDSWEACTRALPSGFDNGPLCIHGLASLYYSSSRVIRGANPPNLGWGAPFLSRGYGGRIFAGIPQVPLARSRGETSFRPRSLWLRRHCVPVGAVQRGFTWHRKLFASRGGIVRGDWSLWSTSTSG